MNFARYARFEGAKVGRLDKTEFNNCIMAVVLDSGDNCSLSARRTFAYHYFLGRMTTIPDSLLSDEISELSG